MRHLSPAEFVDAVEGTLSVERAGHLDSCASCREVVAAIAVERDRAGEVEADEPSPLYWAHLSARIRDRVADQEIAPAWRAEGWRGLVAARLVPLASALVLTAAVIAGGVFLRHGRADLFEPSAGSGSVSSSEAVVHPEEAAAWQVLTAAASDMKIEEAGAAGLSVPAETIDNAVQRLTPDELTELDRLLQSELGGRGH